MPTVYLSLGSNLGERDDNLRNALARLDDTCCRVSAVSRVYETVPVGETPEPVPLYLNCVAKAETDLAPMELLERTQAVEQEGGRIPTFRWGPRAIDVDILLYDGLTLDTERLTIPHPRLYERAFVLIPLADLAPDLVLPDGVSVEEHLREPGVRAQGLRVWSDPPLARKMR